jgi:6-phosphogluconolactonase
MGFPKALVFGDSAAVAREAAERILDAAQRAITARGIFHLVLAGGTTPTLAYRLLGQSGIGADADWSRWQIWYGDERCLPVDDPERNSVMAERVWLQDSPIPRANIHPIPAEQGAEGAAAAYAELIAPVLPFDLVLLGMGEDGHTASLFPCHRHDPAQTVHPVHNAPKPPPDRVSLSGSVLSGAREVLMLVTGAGKREALARWRAGEALPIASIRATALLLDKAAAGDAVV